MHSSARAGGRPLCGILRQLAIPCLALAPGGRVLGANELARELFRLGEDEAEGATVSELQERAAWSEESAMRLSDGLRGQGAFEVELQGGGSAGGWRELEARGIPLLGESGRQEGHLLCFVKRSDRVTRQPWAEVESDMGEGEKELNRLRESLRQAEAERDAAQRSSEAKTRFLADMSHEIRTPMNAVIGFCDLLAKTELNDEQEECLDAIGSSGQLLIQLVNQVLDFSKIESGHLDLRDEVVDLRQLLRETHAILKGKARLKGIDFLLDERGLEVPLVRGDGVRVKQVLINLLSNAIKFTRRGHVMLIASSQPSEDAGYARVKFEIHDTGIGIGPRQLEQLFLPFMQFVERNGMDEQQGSGLGLAICKSLARAMGGDIRVSSEPGQGTSFTVEASLREFCSQDGGAASRIRDDLGGGMIHPQPKQPLRVLVVDDNPNNLLITTKLTEHLGYKVETVPDGIKALERLSASKIDIVLLDIRMSPIDGIETCRRIRQGACGEERRDVHIIALTAHALEGDRQRCLDAGLDEYLPKPLHLEQLRATLKRAESRINA